ncbi:MAG: ABC transporter ATP-binding protein [Turicibacter sp.]
MESIKWVMRYLKPYKFKYGLAMVLVFVVSGMNLLNPMLSGKIIDDVMTGGKKQLLVPILLMMLGVVIVKALISYAYQVVFETVSQDIIFEIREECYKKLMVLDFEFYNSTRTGDLMARLTGDTDAIRHFISWVIYTIVANLLVFLFAMIYMFQISPILTICLVSVTPIIAYLTIRMTKEVGPTFHGIREAFSRLNSVVQENISGNRVVKAFASEEYEIEKFMKENENYREKNLNSSRIWQKYLPILDSSAGTLSVIMVFVGGLLVILDKMTMGDLVVFNGLIWALNNPMRMAGWMVNDIQRFVAAGDKVRQLLEVQAGVKEAECPVEISKVNGHVTFEEVSFQYGTKKVLNNISFHIEAGQTVGIIGPTGSGKTTLVNLIARFYDATSGKILIDGLDIKKLPLIDYRNQIGMAMQDIFLFSDTIEGNIAFGNPDAKEDQIKKVSQIAEANLFIEKMQEGYDTIVGERGVGLSGGQKQRISLARALLKEPTILILDDTTSAVDMETEQNIQQSMSSILNKCTNFIIAHRISSVKNADVILVMNEGEIIEKGSHDELMNLRGYYYDVYQTQFKDLKASEGEL